MTRPPEDLRHERALDALLAADVVPPPSAGLRRAILLDFERRAGGFWRTVWRELGGVRIVAPAFTASLALGVAVAASIQPSVDPVEDVAPGYAELALLDGTYEDYLP